MSKKILVADDSVVIQKSIGITFAQEDFEVKFVSNGEDALTSCPEFQPNIILADVTMPKLGGVDLTKKLKSSPDTQNIPVLLLAGARDDMNTEKAQSCGANDVVQKPFDSNELLQKVNSVMGHSAPAAAVGSPEPVAAPAVEAPESDFGAMDDIQLDVEIPADTPNEEAHTSGFTPFSMDQEPSIDLSEMPSDALGSDTVNPTDTPQEDVLKTEVHYKDDPAPAAEEAGIEFSMDVTPDLEANDMPAPSTPEPSVAEPEPSAAPTSAEVPVGAQVQLSDDQIENIVTRVFQNVIERIAWEVVPDLAERIIREEIQRLTGENEGSDS